MARIRTVKPEFWQDEKVAPMPAVARLVFLGLVSMADDAGRLVDNVKSIDGFIFPETDDSSRESLDTLASAGRITRYSAPSGQRLIQITNWARHQKVDRPSKHLLPAPSLTEGSRDTRESLAPSSRSDLGPGTMDQGPSTNDRGAEGPPEAPASLLAMLPPEAMQLLTQFYEFPAMTAAQAERYRAVAMELVDAIDPKHAGPKIRGGVRVKAQSAQHMADCCRAVIANPPMDRDLAVLWVLKKLTDPVKGPSVTEALSRTEGAARQAEDLYALEAKAEGIRWAKNHPAEYAPILAEVESTYRGRSGKIIDLAKTSELTQRCAKAAGFPTFDEWVQTYRRAG